MMKRPRRDVWTPIAGVSAAVTFVAGVILSSASPKDSASDAQVIAWYTHHGHRLADITGAYLLAACGLFLLWFVSGLRQRLRAAEGPGGRLSTVALGGGILCVGMLWVGAAALASISGAESFGGVPAIRSADLARFLPQVGDVAILLFSMFGAIALIDATSVVIWRTGILPRWFAWLGFICAVVLLFGVVFIPMVAFPVWLLAGSVILFRLPSIEAEPVVAVPTPPT
jgi:hypothetical protein